MPDFFDFKMILAIDIGNSFTKFGIFDGELLIKRFSIPTVRQNSAAEIYELIGGEINQKFDSVVVSSVVTELKNSYTKLAEINLDSKVIFAAVDFDFGLKINYYPPENLGIDRLVAAFAAVEKYGKPVIVCDFGTATTIDAVNKSGEFLGGIITPGINTLSEALFLKTSKLPHIKPEKPDSIFGNSTVTSIQAGIFFGYLGLVEGILRRMLTELDEAPKIVATGGFAKLIAENCDLIDRVSENLMLDGLHLMYDAIIAEN